MDWTGWVEISSDLVGFASGVVLAWPTYQLLRAKKTLYDTRVNLQKEAKGLMSDDPRVKSIFQKIEGADAKISKFEPSDFDYAYKGFVLLLVSFALKVIFHIFK